jgi:sugar (pentulose or hexulose) kinase
MLKKYYNNIEEAVAAMVKTEKTFTPNSKYHDLYDRLLKLYGELYETLKPVFRRYT